MSESSVAGVADLQRFLECFNRHDVDGIMGYFAEDCVYETPRGQETVGRRIEGKEAIREHFAKMFRNVPDTHFGEDHHWLGEDGTRGVSEWTLTGTTPAGTRLHVRGCDLFTLRDGRIVRKDSYLKSVQPESSSGQGGKAWE